MKKLFLILIILLITFPRICWSATINAASCSQTDVQTAINSASNGDTVQIPAGACTWTSAVTINSSSSRTKMVKINGAGTDASTGTRITLSVSGPNPGLVVYLSSSLPRFELSNIRFIEGVYSSADEALWGIQLGGHADTWDSQIWIHDNYFLESTGACGSGGWQNSLVIGGLNTYGTPDNGHAYIWGLINNNTWHSDGRSFQAIDVMPLYSKDASGNYLHGCVSDCNSGHLAWRDWTIADHQGTWKNLFIEHNTFESTNGITSQAVLDFGGGAAAVIRYNTFINNFVGGHGPDTLGGARGAKWKEVYENDFITNTSSYVDDHSCTDSTWVMATGFESGTGVQYNNRFWDASHKGTGNPKGITGTKDFHSSFNYFEYIRTDSGLGTPPCQAVACGDETTSTCDNMDISSDPGKGWICWDMTGSAKGSASVRTLGYTFSSHPVVYWNNIWSDTSTKIGPVINGGASIYNYLQERREYIKDTSCAGHMGETICSTFWDSVNGKKLGYTPYTYPHPLRGSKRTLFRP